MLAIDEVMGDTNTPTKNGDTKQFKSVNDKPFVDSNLQKPSYLRLPYLQRRVNLSVHLQQNLMEESWTSVEWEQADYWGLTNMDYEMEATSKMETPKEEKMGRFLPLH